MRVLFSCCPLSGHCRPMLPLAQAFVERGHQVRVMTGTEMGPTVSEAGLDLVAVGPDFMAMVAETMARVPDAPLDTPDDQQRFGFGQLFSDGRVDLTLPEALTAARSFEPELIVNEVADFVGPLVAAIFEIPNVTLGEAMIPRREWIDAAAAGVARHWQRHSLEPRPDAGLFRHLYLDQWPASAQYPHIAEIGPVESLRPTAVGEDEALSPDLDQLGRTRPLVYVTLGTQFNDGDVFARLLEGVDPLDVDVVVTVGAGVDPAPFRPVRPGIEIRSFLPQGAVLPRCALVVCHGGAGTVLGALSHGVPLVIVPGGADQQENATQLVATGAAELVAGPSPAPAEVRQIVQRVLGSESHRLAAEGLADELRSKLSPAECAVVIEQSLTAW